MYSQALVATLLLIPTSFAIPPDAQITAPALLPRQMNGPPPGASGSIPPEALASLSAAGIDPSAANYPNPFTNAQSGSPFAFLGGLPPQLVSSIIALGADQVGQLSSIYNLFTSAGLDPQSFTSLLNSYTANYPQSQITADSSKYFGLASSLGLFGPSGAAGFPGGPNGTNMTMPNPSMLPPNGTLPGNITSTTDSSMTTMTTAPGSGSGSSGSSASATRTSTASVTSASTAAGARILETITSTGMFAPVLAALFGIALA